MLDLLNYFDPLSIEEPVFANMVPMAGFSHSISVHTENNTIKEVDKFKIAIIGVPDGRGCPLPGTMKAPDSIRKQLYQLARVPGSLDIVDLGNMKKGVTFDDTLAGLADVLVFLAGKEVFPLIIGGNSALMIAVDRAMNKLKREYVLATIDSRIDYIGEKDAFDAISYLKKIGCGKKSAMSHFINIGYQTQLNDQKVISRFAKKESELIRIGEARKAIHLTEPLIRDTDIILFDMSSVRQSEAPGTLSPSPNGFYGEEICLLSRYAGLSDSLKLFALFDVDPDLDVREQTTGLAAQVVWFFLEGFSQKQYETPYLDIDTGRFTRYHVRVDDLDEEIIFIKSNFTDRWWVELVDEMEGTRYLACSNEDYLKANRNEIPERWLLGSRKS